MRNKNLLYCMFSLNFCILCLSFTSVCVPAELGFEAEDADVLVPVMAVFEDPTASGGNFIAAGLGGGGRQAGWAEYSLDIFVDGKYTVWGRVLTESDGTDSLHVTMDDDNSPQAADTEKIWDTGQPFIEWTWSKVVWREDNALAFELDKGQHTLYIWSREGNTRLDAIYMSTDANATPKLPDEVEEQGPQMVDITDKLATTWGSLKE